jgi:hypothetical protein
MCHTRFFVALHFKCKRFAAFMPFIASSRALPCCRYETNLLNTAAQAMELIEGEVQHPNVFVHLDSYHMNIEENR